MRTLLTFILVILYVPVICTAAEKEIDLLDKVDHQQGLSSSAVLCIFQDINGLMWFGTYDGINCYDGKSMDVFRTNFSDGSTLTNNIIHSIQQGDNDCLWITTHLGINRFSQLARRVVENHYSFTGIYNLHSNNKGNAWVVNQKGIYYYNTYHYQFVKLKTPPPTPEEFEKRAFVANDGSLWLFLANSGIVRRYTVDSFEQDTLKVRDTVVESRFHAQAIHQLFYQNGVLCFIDAKKDLYVYDVIRKSKIYIRNISGLIKQYGKIRGIVPFYDDIVIGFTSNGLMRLSASQKYEAEIFNQNARVFDLYQDPRQNILWIATDGQGALKYAKKYSIATNLKLDQLSANLSRPVRSILTDKHGGMWLGTKGDGLVHIPDYAWGASPETVAIHTLGKKQWANSFLRWDCELRIYKLKQSRYRDGFWIGSGDPGLCFYSFESNSIRAVENPSSYPLTHVHDIYEVNDTLLYLLSEENGLQKFIIEEAPKGHVRIKKHQKYRFFSGQQELNFFYSMIQEGDSLLWLGSREQGLVRFDRKREEYIIFSLSDMLHKSVNDVLCMLRASNGTMYLGTTSGLVSLTMQDTIMTANYIGREQGMLNDMVHGILEDGNGFLWLSTNRGLTKYNPRNGLLHAYYYTAGLKIGEFSDDAYYRSPFTGELFFGGVDGLLYLDNKVETAPPYYPEILLRKLRFGKTEVAIGDYLTPDGKGISFDSSVNFFAFTFVTPDYISGAEVEYSYKLEGYESDWEPFSSQNEALYTNVPPGKYLFKVRYKKDVSDTEYKEFSIPLSIAPPWYGSAWAYMLYLLAVIGVPVYSVKLYRRHVGYKQRLSGADVVVDSNINDKTTRLLPESEIAQSFSLIAADLGDLADRFACTSPEQIAFIRKVLQVIEANIDREELGSSFIADRLAMSPRQFYRKFKDISGIPPGDLIKNYRMEKASRLLLNNQLTIQECIADTGITSRSYFYKEFTRKYGMTPKDYRDQHRVLNSDTPPTDTRQG